MVTDTITEPPATQDQTTAAETCSENPQNQELWYTIFAEGHPLLKKYQRINKRLPSAPRCKLCHAPFRGIGGMIMALTHRGPSHRNPRYCSKCDSFIRAFPGGAEVELSMVFVDVRGSTPLAERNSPTDYATLMTQFYTDATAAFIETEGFIMDVAGDEVFALYPPGFSGKDHAALAIRAAEKLLKLSKQRNKLPMGIGVHTGNTFIGTVIGAEQGIADVRVLGDTVNTAARICSVAKVGEALVSAASCTAAGLPLTGESQRELELKGKQQKMTVKVLTAH